MLRGSTAAVIVTLLAACASETPEGVASNNRFTGIDETEAELTQLANGCQFTDAGALTVTLASGEYLLLGPSTSGAMLANGRQCGTATASSTLRVTITAASDAGDETVILDYLHGSFALGVSNDGGVTIDLKGGANDRLKLRGSNGADTVVLGTTTAAMGSAGSFSLSLAIDADGGVPDGYKDVSVTNVESFVISTGPGNDVINGAGNAYGTGSSAFATVTSGTSPTLTLYGGDGDDVLTGGSGDDVIRGEAGNDTLTGGLGNDVEWGGAGDDSFTEGASANGSDVLNGGDDADGGPGVDVVKYDQRTSSVTAVLGGGAVSGGFTVDAGFENDTIASTVEVVYTGAGNDVLSCAGAPRCTLHGNGGNDTLTGGAGDDFLYGEGGNDTLMPGQGDDTVDCGSSTGDTVSYADRGASENVQVVLGTAGVASTNNGVGIDGGVGENDVVSNCEYVVGGAGDDSLTGNDLDNHLTGGLGNDTLVGLAGNDVFDEGSAANGSDTFSGGLGEDLVDYSHRTGALVCDLSDSTANDGEAGEGDDIALDVEDLYGGSGGSDITGNDSANKIDPGSGTNTVICGADFDILIPHGTTSTPQSDCEASAAPLVSIAVTPTNPTSIKSTTRQFTATGTYSDGTTQNLTASPSLTWTSTSTSTAIISNSAASKGLASTINPGTTTIRATVGAINGSTTLTVLAASLVSISLTPNGASVALGFTRTYLALGSYTDGSTQDLSSQVTWASSNEAVAIISNDVGSQGLASTLSQGSSTITATLGAVHGTTVLTVTAPALIGPIVLSPSDPSVAVSSTQQFTAEALFSDGSTQDITTLVTWSSSDSNVCSISNASGTEGLATGEASGSATVSAALSGQTASTSMTVTP